jgi:N-acetylneuraminic acid mutarotase
LKKQNTRNVKAHLLRGTFYMLLFVEVVMVALSAPINMPKLASKVLTCQDNNAFVKVRESASSVLGSTTGKNQTLTFADRVTSQRAIEGVYWRHRIWPKENPDPKPSLDAVMSQAQMEKKVEDYLRKSQALETYWQGPITAEQLQAEMDRMAKYTEQPEVLHELFDALGNDPFVIAECLARPALAESLLMHQGIERLKQTSQACNRIVPAATNFILPVISDTPFGCLDNSWAATSNANAPADRFNHTAVWTGSEMIVWGGTHDLLINLKTGGRYYPATDTWTDTSIAGAPFARSGHTAIWTGTEMIIWGGNADNSGGRYDPITDSWTTTSTANAPAGRNGHSAVWTGNQMIVWGGVNFIGFTFNTGGKYNPSTNTWTPTTTTNAPATRTGHTAVWTGTEMIIWGGWNGLSGLFNSGGKYNPVTNNWTDTSVSNSPSGRYGHSAVWTGSEMIVWGGGSNDYFDTGAQYNPRADTWIATSTSNVPTGRTDHAAIWSGSEMIVWGGFGASGVTKTGGRYNPGTNSWTGTSRTHAPAARSDHTAVWTGSEMIVWGGANNAVNALGDGGRYCGSDTNGDPNTIRVPKVRPAAASRLLGSQIP